MKPSLPPVLADSVSAGPLESTSSQPELLGLPELAAACGELAKPAPDGGKYLWRHNVASFLHGWHQHEYHQNCAVTLTLDDYKAALAAVDSQTTHGPAVRKADKA